MKNFKILVSEAYAESYLTANWDSDCFADPIEAETDEEAIELAKDYLLDNGCTEEEVENILFLAEEV